MNPPRATAAPPETAPQSLAPAIPLAFTLLLTMAPWFTTAAIVSPLRAAWHISAAQAGWLTIAAQIGFVAGALASALLTLADLVRPRWLFLIGGLAAAAANAALAACHSFGAAWPWRFATGACLALVYPPALKLMATWFRGRRGTALGIMVGALTVGAAWPHLVRSWSGDWQRVVLATSLITAAGGIWGALAGREGPFPFARARFAPAELPRAFANRGVRLATVGYLGHMWELVAMWSWIAPLLAARFAAASIPAHWAALASFLVIAAGGVGCWYGGLLSDRGGREPAAATAMAISGACACTVGWIASPAPWAIACLLAVSLIWGFWVVADSAQFSTLVTELADPRYTGTALTAQLGAGFTLAAVTVWLIPWLAAHGGWGWAFTALAPGPAIGIAAMARLHAGRASSI